MLEPLKRAARDHTRDLPDSNGGRGQGYDNLHRTVPSGHA